jgi:hypothetical protein
MRAVMVVLALLAVLSALIAVGCSHSSGDVDDGGPPPCQALEAGAQCGAGTPTCFQCVAGNGFDCSCESDSGTDPYTDASIWFCVGTGYTCH